MMMMMMMMHSLFKNSAYLQWAA